MEIMELIFLFLFIRGIINSFSQSRKKAKERKTSNSSNQFESREVRKKEGAKFASVLSELQNQLENLEKEVVGIDLQDKPISYAKTFLEKEKTKESKRQVLKPQVLKTERQNQAEFFSNSIDELAEGRILVSDLDEYYDSLYGEDDSLFDYDSVIELEAEWESDEASSIANVFNQKTNNLDLKTAVIFSEILDKPLAMRK